MCMVIPDYSRIQGGGYLSQETLNHLRSKHPDYWGWDYFDIDNSLPFGKCRTWSGRVIHVFNKRTRLKMWIKKCL